jgi:hypothetical protein
MRNIFPSGQTSSFRAVLELVAHYDMALEQMDVR